jgi:hypothetical protein
VGILAKRTLNATLSTTSIRKLQDELKKYQNDLTTKCKLLAKELAEIGVKVAEARIGESPLGKYVSIQTDITEEQAGCKAILIATGEVKESEGYAPFNTLLAIEFGAGIHHNPTPNPSADKFGLGVGTFPGQIHAFEDGWYYWDDKAQEWRYTHGVKATMPMYSADMAIIKDVVKTAKEVFSK